MPKVLNTGFFAHCEALTEQHSYVLDAFRKAEEQIPGGMTSAIICMALGTFADPSTGTHAEAPVRRIAAMTGIPRSTVDRHLKLLVKSGFLKTDKCQQLYLSKRASIIWYRTFMAVP